MTRPSSRWRDGRFWVGLAALVWFVVRVVPRPQRAAYPCQRAAFPLASAFVLWMAGLVAGRFAFRRLIARYHPSGLALALALMGAFAAGATWLVIAMPADDTWAWTPTDPPNRPMGTAKGLYPGRVVWSRDVAATPWNGSSGHWWDDATGIRQDVVDRMLSDSLRALTGGATDGQAWDQLFRHSNRARGRGDVGYATGEKIAFKINVNNAYGGYGDADNQIDASPQAVLAMLRQLVREAGVAPDRITVYEAVRVVPNRIYNKLHAEFPAVVVVDSQGNGSNGRQAPSWQSNVLSYSVSDPGVGRSLPQCVTQATYVINMALLKGHPTTGFTGLAKNHYGSVTTRDHSMYANASKHPMGIYHPFVDMIGSNQLGGKTMLFVSDALYGIRDVNDVVGPYARWNKLFGGQWMASLFLSQDPIAIDSVVFDFLNAEFPAGRGGSPAPLTNSDNFLHEAARADAPPSGTLYRPNGVRLASLGVHEHWNNSSAKQYTRNLGTGEGIELYRVGAPPPTVTPTPTATSTPTPPGEAVYLWPEAESGAVSSPMGTAADATASGGSFVQVASGNNSQAAAPAGGWATLTFSVPAAATYKLWGRVAAPTTSDDSFWVRVDGGAWTNWNNIAPGAAWHWDDVHDAAAGNAVMTYALAAGSHTVTFAYREDGTKLDRILLTNDLAFVPSGLGPTDPTPTPTPTPTPPPVTPTPTPTLPGEGIYLWPEAESGAVSSPMGTAADAAASGGSFVQVASGNNSQAAAPASGWATLTFSVPAAATYKVWGRLAAPTTGDDSFWVRVDGGAWTNWNNITPGAAWHWDDVHDAAAGNAVMTYALAAGSHTVTFAYREDGTKLDRVLLTNDLAFVPSGLGPTDPTPTPTPGPAPTATPTGAPTYVEVTPPGSSATASTSDGNLPANTVDNSLSTRWSANGDGQWLQLDLGVERTVGYVKVAVYNGNSRRNRFDLEVSTGAGVWTTVFTGESSGTTTAEETYDFADVPARWVRYLGHMNNVNAFNSVTEVSVFAVP